MSFKMTEGKLVLFPHNIGLLRDWTSGRRSLHSFFSAGHRHHHTARKQQSLLKSYSDLQLRIIRKICTCAMERSRSSMERLKSPSSGGVALLPIGSGRAPLTLRTWTPCMWQGSSNGQPLTMPTSNLWPSVHTRRFSHNVNDVRERVLRLSAPGVPVMEQKSIDRIGATDKRRDTMARPAHHTSEPHSQLPAVTGSSKPKRAYPKKRKILNMKLAEVEAYEDDWKPRALQPHTPLQLISYDYEERTSRDKYLPLLPLPRQRDFVACSTKREDRRVAVAEQSAIPFEIKLQSIRYLHQQSSMAGDSQVTMRKREMLAPPRAKAAPKKSSVVAVGDTLQQKFQAQLIPAWNKNPFELPSPLRLLSYHAKPTASEDSAVGELNENGDQRMSRPTLREIAACKNRIDEFCLPLGMAPKVSMPFEMKLKQNRGAKQLALMGKPDSDNPVTVAQRERLAPPVVAQGGSVHEPPVAFLSRVRQPEYQPQLRLKRVEMAQPLPPPAPPKPTVSESTVNLRSLLLNDARRQQSKLMLRDYKAALQASFVQPSKHINNVRPPSLEQRLHVAQPGQAMPSAKWQRKVKTVPQGVRRNDYSTTQFTSLGQSSKESKAPNDSNPRLNIARDRRTLMKHQGPVYRLMTSDPRRHRWLNTGEYIEQLTKNQSFQV